MSCPLLPSRRLVCWLDVTSRCNDSYLHRRIVIASPSGYGGIIDGSPWDCLWIAFGLARIAQDCLWIALGFALGLADLFPIGFRHQDLISDRAQALECSLVPIGLRHQNATYFDQAPECSLFPIGFIHENPPFFRSGSGTRMLPIQKFRPGAVPNLTTMRVQVALLREGTVIGRTHRSRIITRRLKTPYPAHANINPMGSSPLDCPSRCALQTNYYYIGSMVWWHFLSDGTNLRKESAGGGFETNIRKESTPQLENEFLIYWFDGLVTFFDRWNQFTQRVARRRLWNQYT